VEAVGSPPPLWHCCPQALGFFLDELDALGPGPGPGTRVEAGITGERFSERRRGNTPKEEPRENGEGDLEESPMNPAEALFCLCLSFVSPQRHPPTT